MDVMYGVEYRYHDQFSNDHRVFLMAFSEKTKAQAWIDASASAPYLRIIELAVDPVPKEK